MTLPIANATVSRMFRDLLDRKDFVRAAELVAESLPHREMDHPDTEARRSMISGAVQAALETDDFYSAERIAELYPYDLNDEAIEDLIGSGSEIRWKKAAKGGNR